MADWFISAGCLKMKDFSYKILIFCIAAVLLLAFLFHPKWKESNTEATISWDVSGYYMYLPAMFIYQDIKKCKFLHEIIQKYHPTLDPQQGFQHNASGNFVLKYSAGQAILMSPFFFVGHTIASVGDKYPTDGFSLPYQKSLGIGMLSYSILGILFLWLVLRKTFSEKITGWTLLIMVFGSNYLLFASTDQCLTHGPLFFLYALLLYIVHDLYDGTKNNRIILIGFICGLMTLIRPTEIISVLIPIFWGVSSWSDLKNRYLWLRSNLLWIITAALIFALVVGIQPLYWKYVTGQWIVYSYQEQGFSWLNPHFKDYTFSFSSGWLTYSPMLILAILGLIVWMRQGKNPLVWIFTSLAYYIVCAWDVWDYGGNAGRAMVQYYPFLAIGLGTLLQKVESLKVKTLIYSLILLFGYFNIWWVYHCYRGEIPALGHSKYFYYAKAGRWKMDAEDLKLMENKYIFKGKKENTSILESNMLLKSNAVPPLKVDKSITYTPEMHILKDSRIREWVRIYADVTTPVKEWNPHAQHLMVYKFYDGEFVVGQGMLKPQRFLNDGERKMLYVDSKVPVKWDKLAVFFWNPGSEKELFVQSVMVETFDEK